MLPLAAVGEVNRPFLCPIPEGEAAMLPLATGKAPPRPMVQDPAEKPSQFRSVSVTSTEVIEAPSSETVRLIIPLFAFPLISIGPVRTAPG